MTSRHAEVHQVEQQCDPHKCKMILSGKHALMPLQAFKQVHLLQPAEHAGWVSHELLLQVFFARSAPHGTLTQCRQTSRSKSMVLLVLQSFCGESAMHECAYTCDWSFPPRQADTKDESRVAQSIAPSARCLLRVIAAVHPAKGHVSVTWK